MSSIKRFLKTHLKPYLPGTLAGAALIVASNSLQAAIFGCLNLMFDNQLGMGGDNQPENPLKSFTLWLLSQLPSRETLQHSLLFIPGLIAVLFFLRAIFVYAGTILVARSGMKAVRVLREQLFDKTLIQDAHFFHRHPVGELMNRILGDVASIQQLASNQVAQFIRQTSLALIMAYYIVGMDWKLALILVAAVPFVLVPTRRISKSIRRAGHRSQANADSLLQRLKEVLSNMRVVKAFAREDYESHRFRELSQGLYSVGMKVVRRQALSGPLMEIIAGLMLMGLTVYGAMSVAAGRLTGGDFLIVILLIYQLYEPIRTLTRMAAELQISGVALDRIFALIDSKPTVVTPVQPKPIAAQPRTLTLEGVRFSYGADEVLRGIDLTLDRGETVALVGGSGGGKTTIANLVLRFFDPTAGRVCIDGIDIREFDPRELRTRIGIVTQETLLFMDTVHDNIAYGKDASRSAVIEAAKKANAHEFIDSLPKGYDTPLTETGASLSGGQRQRIAIARALLQDPPILILDEATSALDADAEQAVQAALDALMKDRTTLVIAHRFSTVQRATRICVLKHGSIVEQGTHAVLLEKGGEYARLYELQFEKLLTV